ncbi:hypothetical protein F2Q69_00031469 [Brassica cretica]|uniref:Uncharacterized protein n=1 Tax=Brassica cretica TaxID=69181 RepID=A0A8S9S6B0_BRACR|nr:hypothetical protein F2Q69_00031469 [Brassica cretica]
MSIDTVHPASIDTVHQNTVHSDNVHCDTVHPNTVHPVKNDTTCGETVKIEVLVLEVKTPSRVFLTKILETTSNSLRISCQGVSRMKCLNTTCSARSSPILSLGMHSAATREKEKNDKWDRFLASLDEKYMILILLLDDIMAKRDEQHGFGEPSKVEEADKVIRLHCRSTAVPQN